MTRAAQGARNPYDNCVMMPFRQLVGRLLSYDPSRGCCGVQGPVSFLHGGTPQHDPGVMGHWAYTTSIFMLLVCECVEKLSAPARSMLMGGGGEGCSLGAILDEWR